MNKKYGIIALLGLLIVLIIISSLITPKKEGTKLSNDPEVILNNAQEESSAVKDEEKKDFIEITLDDYLNMYAASNKSIILIARPTCQYCQIAEPIIMNVAYENSLDINYLNTDNFSEETEKQLTDSDEYFESGLGTPTLLIVGNSKVIDTVDGLTDKAHYIDFFKKNGYLE